MVDNRTSRAPTTYAKRNLTAKSIKKPGIGPQIKSDEKRILKRREALSCIPHSGFFSPRSYLTDDYHSRKSSARSRVASRLINSATSESFVTNLDLSELKWNSKERFLSGLKHQMGAHYDPLKRKLEFKIFK